MFRLALKLALAAAAVWAIWSFVPLNGRTGAERWRAARSIPRFVDGAIAELTGGSPSKPPARPQARQKPSPAPRPTESHTEADRRAVERILADRLDGR
jgi:hypothetical protein